MAVEGVAARLGGSVFLAGLDDRDRHPLRIVGTVVGGLLLGFVAAVVVFLIVIVLFNAVTGGGFSTAIFANAAAQMASTSVGDLKGAIFFLILPAATNGPVALVFIVVAAWLARHRIRDYISAAPTVRWRLLAAGLTMAALMTAPLLIADHLLTSSAPTPPLLTMAPDLAGRAAYAVAALLLLIPAAAAEEVVFRGWFLRQTAAFIRNPWVLIVLNGLVFSAIHLDFNPDSFLTRVLMGSGFAYMTLRLGGIEFSTGAHTANNLLIVLFIEPLTLKPTISPGMSAESLFDDLWLVAGYIIITELVARWAPLRRWTGVRPEELTPTPPEASVFA